MKIFSSLKSFGLVFDPKNPPVGEPAQVAGNAFFDRIYKDGRDTGGRDYSRFSGPEMKLWAQSAPPGAAIVPDIESVQYVEGVTGKAREIAADVRRASGEQIAEDMAYLNAAADAALSANIDPARFGFYGLCPTGFNVQNMIILKQDLAPVRASNDFVFSFPVWKKVGRLHPTLYAATDDQQLWHKILMFQFDECERLKKPCVPFLSPLYHPLAQPRFGNLVPLDYWAFMLEMCHAVGCPAVVLWNGYPDSDIRPHIDATRRWIDKRAPKNQTLNVKDQRHAFRTKKP